MKGYATVKQAAAHLGIGEQKVRELIHAGKLPVRSTSDRYYRIPWTAMITPEEDRRDADVLSMLNDAERFARLVAKHVVAELRRDSVANL